MLFINKQRYVRSDLASEFNKMDATDKLSNPEGKGYAVCVNDPFLLITLLMYLRERSASIILIHEDTPKTTAAELATRARCHYLVYGQLDEILTLQPPATVHEPSLLQFSSGTTGEPKLIARRWSQIDSEIDSYNRKLSPSSMDRPLILVPVSHSYGLITGLLAGMAREAEPIVVHSKNPKFSLHMIQTTENSFVYAVPFLYHLLNALGKDELKYHKLISSGAPLNETLLARLKRVSDEVWQQYGCTETGCVSLGTQLTDYTDVGTPLDDLQVSIASDGTEVSSADLPSEIIVTGGAGRVNTKDVGYWSEGGRLHLSGRMDDLINLSGLKVIPAEVERVMERMPGVEEAVVYRMNHSIWGEAVQALAVVSGAVSQNDLRQWCIEHLPAYKVPSAIKIVKEIPKSAAGKISRKYLCEMERDA
ncbi:AMP-binding protein [Cohnella cholangitidis]|nr:AMP-binding protein [Cohnella cholangitidis]